MVSPYQEALPIFENSSTRCRCFSYATSWSSLVTPLVLLLRTAASTPTATTSTHLQEAWVFLTDTPAASPKDAPFP